MMESLSYDTTGETTYPGVRLRAIDENGNGVPNLRVRLRVLNHELFPDMPKLTEIISCGLVTRDEFNSDPGAARELNSRPEMDGVSRTEAALACVTDADGYVEMVVKYAEELGAASFLRQVFTVRCNVLSPHRSVSS